MEILVEALGRVNFGPEAKDFKGIVGSKGIGGNVRFAAEGAEPQELHSWDVMSLPLDATMLANLKYESATKASEHMPAFWRATVNIAEPGDTFLDMRSWGKGVVWVNDHCIGRYWNIGPTQTMFVPGPWLKRGENQIVILDLLGPDQPTIAGLAKPILNQLRLNRDITPRRFAMRPC